LVSKKHCNFIQKKIPIDALIKKALSELAQSIVAAFLERRIEREKKEEGRKEQKNKKQKTNITPNLTNRRIAWGKK